MTEREAFIAAIAANPDDDTARLAFADYLDEHGEEDRAEFIRIACEIAARRRDGSWSGPLPDGVEGLWERAHDLFTLRGSFWLEPFYRAIGADDRPAPPRSRWPSRVWRRWTGEPRHTFGLVDCFPGDSANLKFWGNGPVTEIDLARGLVEHVRLNLESPFPVEDLPTAFRLEPVHRLSIRFAPNAGQWKRLDLPCLRRVCNLNIELPAVYTAKTAAALDELARSDNWSGVRSLSFWCPSAGRLLTPGEYVSRLVRSPLMARLDSLRAVLAADELLCLTGSPDASAVRALELWWCDLPAEAAAALAAASFRPNLEELGLSSNRLGDDGARALAAVPWPKLRSLDLGCNDLTDAGVRHLLPLAPQLTDVFLASSEITDAGALALADALDPNRLNSLWLSYNPLSPAAVAVLRARFGERFHFRTQAEDRAAAY